ncbi:replicative DNA helicase [Porcincola intestinalis]|jgi:replicative DNA helicase|uniref:Replicative DNA helicase n=3 Tax=Porcincola intestinalis TaxID=2606632 RepID=A0A6L5X924_9FIRM|nr:replicative DNA helicase [Porcincola intestinalis]MCI6699494.1 replicative DNA helicase [Lachnospiraceae bacterium]MCI6767532.1 replicative DNA helicase [Lachnospiraceae bacterium]MCI7093270.1 replicative DNA helicase [Lachnospiraceae bacterium]MDD7059412.1 replicative DNA helicase [Porcincola intestinalis]MDY5284013.1 replicative DNA helicase [Porcincola intestinalis]
MPDEELIKRILPHDQAAESSVIGSMMMDPEAISVAQKYLSPDDFYQKSFGLLFSAIVSLDNEGQPVDSVTIQNRLREMDAPENIATDSYLAQLVTAVPTSTNIEYYAKIVADKSRLRTMIRTMESLTNSCYLNRESVQALMAETEEKMFRVLQTKESQDYVPIQDVVMEEISKISAAARQNSSVTGLSTGFADLDFKTSGFQPSDLILIAARPSMGKTAFALNIGDYMAIRQHKNVAIFSLEMSKGQLVRRLFAQEANIDAQKLRNGNLASTEWDSLIAGADMIGKSGLIIDDTPGITVPEMRSKCRRYKLEQGLDIIIIDYLQLMSGSSKRSSDSRQQEISEISRSLKGLARELNVPVVALSQLSRAVEQRPDHRPVLSDLRESGAIEQDADVVMFLYREDYYKPDTERKGIADCIIAKQRNGPLGDVELAWLPEYTKFASIERSMPQI